jgi:hypothetical protein
MKGFFLSYRILRRKFEFEAEQLLKMVNSYSSRTAEETPTNTLCKRKNEI